MFNGSIQMFSAHQIESLPVFDGIGIEMTSTFWIVKCLRLVGDQNQDFGIDLQPINELSQQL